MEQETIFNTRDDRNDAIAYTGGSGSEAGVAAAACTSFGDFSHRLEDQSHYTVYASRDLWDLSVPKGPGSKRTLANKAASKTTSQTQGLHLHGQPGSNSIMRLPS